MLKNRDLKPRRSTHYLAVIAGLLSTLFAGPIHAAAEAKPSSPSSKRQQLNISPVYKYYIAYKLIMGAQAEKPQALERMKGQGSGTP
jgi:hypothetical protein